VGQVFFPLDEELALLPGELTPHVQECLVRLGTWVPSFDRVTELVAAFTGVVVAEPTARRQTEAAGAAYVAVQTAAVERLERELPPAPPGPAKQVLEVDGAMVPLLQGEWAEVKTLVIGEVAEPVLEQGEWVVHSHDLSYFSRLMDSDTFGRLALVETHRRGVETAGQVAAVADGAEWEQEFFDLHRPDAVRILDFPHAAERISQIGQAVWGEAASETAPWLATQLHNLKHDGPATVLTTLRTLQEAHPDLAVLRENLTYLEKREAHMQYPTFQAQGWPIGSGAVESGHKVVVEARLHGAGMHWAREHVNPLVALRNAVCNDRWNEAWAQIATHLRQQAARRRQTRQHERRAATATTTLPGSIWSTPAGPEPLASLPAPLIPAPPQIVVAPPATETVSAREQEPAPKEPRRPAPDHPWRHSRIGRARYQPAPSAPPAKT
jgi:hypothetical protein